MELKYIKPRCTPMYYNENGHKVYDTRKIKGIAYIANGLLLPCCWCDQIHYQHEFEERGMRDEKLKLENNNSVEDIVESEPWKKFIYTILHEPENATTLCRARCGVYSE
mgnify:CR=1 FL=1